MSEAFTFYLPSENSLERIREQLVESSFACGQVEQFAGMNRFVVHGESAQVVITQASDDMLGVVMLDGVFQEVGIHPENTIVLFVDHRPSWDRGLSVRIAKRIALVAGAFIVTPAEELMSGVEYLAATGQ